MGFLVFSELGETLLGNVSYVALLKSRKNLENKREKKSLVKLPEKLVIFVK